MKKLAFYKMLEKFFKVNGLPIKKAPSMWGIIIAYIQTQLIEFGTVRVCDLGVFKLVEESDKITISFKASVKLNKEVGKHVFDSKSKSDNKRAKQSS